MKNLFLKLFFFFFFFTSFFLFVICENKKDKIDEEIIAKLDQESKVIEKTIHGFSLNQFSIDSGVVASGESFGELLQSLGVSFKDINTLSENYKSIYDIRRIYPGHKYYKIRKKDSSTLSKFIYQHSPTELIVMNFEDSVSMNLFQKPVIIKLKHSGGKIKNSLWQSFMNNKLTPALVSNVANLYAWTIDFFDIQPDDYCKIIYESKYSISVLTFLAPPK